MSDFLIHNGSIIPCQSGHQSALSKLGFLSPDKTRVSYKSMALNGYSRCVIVDDAAFVDPGFPKNVAVLCDYLIMNGKTITNTRKIASDIFDGDTTTVVAFTTRANESISKHQLLPVVKSFKRLASREPDNELQKAMGPEAWIIQVERAAQDFENYLSRITNRILGRLSNGGYAPPSALRTKKRPLDVDTDKKELSKVGSKSTRAISKILGI